MGEGVHRDAVHTGWKIVRRVAGQTGPALPCARLHVTEEKTGSEEEGGFSQATRLLPEPGSRLGPVPPGAVLQSAQRTRGRSLQRVLPAAQLPWGQRTAPGTGFGVLFGKRR